MGMPGHVESIERDKGTSHRCVCLADPSICVAGKHLLRNRIIRSRKLASSRALETVNSDNVHY